MIISADSKNKQKLVLKIAEKPENYVIPIVFPDYLIDIDDHIDLIQNSETAESIAGWLGINVAEGTTRASGLGHAGILLIRKDGTAKYFEYGRYDTPKGEVRNRKINNVKIVNKGIEVDSFKRVLRTISAQIGKKSNISAVIIKVQDRLFEAMLQKAELLLSKNEDSNREPYDALSNSCLDFVQKVMEAGFVQLPIEIDPRPNSYIEELQLVYRDLFYKYTENELKIEKELLIKLWDSIWGKNGYTVY